MDDTYHILRGSAVADDAQDNDKTVRISVIRTSDNIYETDIKAVVDSNEQFMKERDACREYRIIFTLVPFCSNVLFNTCTEIVRYEGSDRVECIDGENKKSLTGRDKTETIGLVSNLSPYEMIRDSEYSKDSIGFEYLPGLDIFNNHILRNTTYRIVNYLPSTASTTTKRVFNTIEDFMRASNGVNLLRCCRLEVTDTTMRKKHLYDYDDILKVYDNSSKTANLVDQDGWFGFYNTSVIPSKDNHGKELDINRVLNNKENCEFVDMYPDRSLFSVIPKYNKYRNRLEYNWDYTITYPFDHTTTYSVSSASGTTTTKEFLVVSEGGCNSLAVLDAQYVMLPSTKNAMMFRTPVKHNLKSGDKIKLFFNKEDGSGNWIEIEEPVIVNGVGDLSNNNQDYYFYVTDTSFLDKILIPDSDTNSPWDYISAYFYNPLNTGSIASVDNDKKYYPGNLVRYNNSIWICDTESKGFSTSKFHVFDQSLLPVYDSTDGLTDIPTEYESYIRVGNTTYELYNHDLDVPFHESAYDANRFIRQIISNAFRDNDSPVNQSSSTTQSPLWADYIQLRFAKTDGKYTSEYYIRKFKKVPNIKYGTDSENPLTDSDFDDEYYKLAFARTVYGDEIAQSVVMDDIDISNLKDNLGRPLTEVYLTVVKTNRGHSEWYDGNIEDKRLETVEFSHCFSPVTCGINIHGQCSDTNAVKDKRLAMVDVHMICNEYSDDNRTLMPSNDIKISDEWFYGDVAEFCPWTCEETVLSDVMFRFNTAQREYKDAEGSKYPFCFDEILSDDYDYNGFKVEKYTIKNANYKKEGYFYKPHYRMQLRGFGNVHQESHRALVIARAEPIQMDGIYIKVKTVVSHKMYGGERVRLREKFGQCNEWWLSVVSVPDKYHFVMDRVHNGNGIYINWMDICDGLNNGTMVLEVENSGIPEYAKRIGKNTYLWRNITNKWDLDNTTVGLEEFPFANGKLYVDSVFNMFVRRQDPYGCNRLHDGKDKTAAGEHDWSDSIYTTCPNDAVSDIPTEPDGLYKDDSFSIC